MLAQKLALELCFRLPAPGFLAVIEGHDVLPVIVELSGARVSMVGYLGFALDHAPILEIVDDASAAQGMVAEDASRIVR